MVSQTCSDLQVYLSLLRTTEMDPLFIMVSPPPRTLLSFSMVQLDSSGPTVRYVPNEETVILIMCIVFVNHKKRTCNTNDRLVDVIVFYPRKQKLQHVPPSMPLEALLILVDLTDSDSDSIDGGTGCNFYLLYLVPIGLSWDVPIWSKKISEN